MDLDQEGQRGIVVSAIAKAQDQERARAAKGKCRQGCCLVSMRGDVCRGEGGVAKARGAPEPKDLSSAALQNHLSQGRKVPEPSPKGPGDWEGAQACQNPVVAFNS